MIPDRLEPVLAELRPLAERFVAAGHHVYLVGGTVRDLLLGRDDHRRLRPHHRRAARRDQASARAAGPTRSGRRASASARSALARDDRVIRDHDAPGRGVPPRLAQARGRVRRRDRGRPVAARLHRERHGARAARPARSSTRSTARCDLAAGRLRTPLARRVASATTRCGCCAPPASSPATGSHPMTSWSTRSASCAAGSRSCPPSASATSSTSCIIVDHPSAGLWFLVDTGLADEFLPELPAMRLEQDPIHRHKDVLAHTIAVVENVHRERRRRRASASCGWPRCSTTSASRRRARSPGQGRDVPPPRGGRRAHDARADAGACATRTTTSRPSRELVELHLRFHTYQMGWTDSGRAPLRARRRDRCSTS